MLRTTDTRQSLIHACHSSGHKSVSAAEELELASAERVLVWEEPTVQTVRAPSDRLRSGLRRGVRRPRSLMRGTAVEWLARMIPMCSPASYPAVVEEPLPQARLLLPGRASGASHRLRWIASSKCCMRPRLRQRLCSGQRRSRLSDRQLLSNRRGFD
jgi:hypothetical protein